MTVVIGTNIKYTEGDGSNRTFPYDFLVLDASHLVVKLVDAAGAVLDTLTLYTDYTVTGLGVRAGGNVVLDAGYPAPTAGQFIHARRVVPLEQQADLLYNEAPDQDVLERGLDLLTMIAQQQGEELDRCMRLPDTDLTGADAQLPTPQAGRVIGWNASATALVNLVSAGEVAVTAFMETLLDDSDAAAALTTLGVTTFMRGLLADVDAAAALSTLGAADDSAVAKLDGGNTFTDAQDFTGATVTVAAPSADANPARKLDVDAVKSRGDILGLTPRRTDVDELTFLSGDVEIEGIGYHLNAETAIDVPALYGASLPTDSKIYVYLDAPSSGNVLTGSSFKVSADAPDYDSTKKAWYHPTTTDWRCVAFWLTDSSGNLLEGAVTGGVLTFLEPVNIFESSGVAYGTPVNLTISMLPDIGRLFVYLHVWASGAASSFEYRVGHGGSSAGTYYGKVMCAGQASSGGTDDFGQGWRMTNDSQQVTHHANVSGTAAKLYFDSIVLPFGFAR